MDPSKVDNFLLINSKYLPSSKLMLIRERLLALDDSRYAVLASVQLQDPMFVWIISFFGGGLGIDRFLIRDFGFGLFKLLTGGLCGILWIIDLFLIYEKAKEYNFQNLIQHMLV